MRRILSLATATIVGCSACQPLPDAGIAATAADQPPPTANQSQSDCRPFSAPMTAAGQPEQASGQACRQADGSWRVVQSTPGLPTQEYLVPRPDPQPANGTAPAPSAQTASAEPSPATPSCTSYTVPVTVGGQEQQAVVEACQQGDGSWRITQTTPGLPPQVYSVPPPAYAPYPADYAYPYPYGDFFPYWAEAPWLFGLAPSIVVVQRFHHFHHGFGHGFHHGFGHGFAHGFGHGFGHGFAGLRGGGMGGGHR
jgi:hypothetical protein